MYPTLVFGCALLVFAARLAIHPERRLVPPVIAFGLLTIGSSILGCATGVINTFHYVQKVPSADQVQIAALGCAESLNNVVLGFMIGMMAGVLAAVAAVRMSRRDNLSSP